MKAPDFIIENKFTESLCSLVEKQKSRFYKNECITTIDCSTVTECARRLMYRALGTNQTNKSSTEICADCSAIDRWANIFKDYINDKNYVVSDCNYNLVGKIDLILEIDDEITIAKLKSIDNEKYSNILSNGVFRRDAIELIMLSWLAEKESTILIYENRDNLEYKIYQIKPYEPVINGVLKRCRDFRDLALRGELPERSYKERSGECEFCESLKDCWNDNNDNQES